ncbi:MAG: peptide deformylase [bacterium]|nr:peptide deformylase [bacterium]
MSLLKITTFPDTILRLKAEDITDIDQELIDLINSMYDTLYEYEGLGLAAPQISVSKKLFVIDTKKYYEDGEKLLLINPEIVEKEGSEKLEEGCLSVPDIHCEVKRAIKILFRGYNLDGKLIEREAEGLLARVIQHEFDHLNGILFIDRISTINKHKIAKDLKKLKEKG